MSDQAVEQVPYRGGRSHCFRIAMFPRRQPRLHVHDAHEFYFCERGRGSQHTSAGVFPMRSGELYCFPAGVPHIGNGAADGRSVGIVLTLRSDVFATGDAVGDEQSRSLAALCAAHPASRPRVPLQADSRRHLRRICVRLVEEFRDRPIGFRSAVQGLLQEFLVLLLRDPETGPTLRSAVQPPRPDEQLDLALRMCTTQYARDWTVAELAELVGLGRSRFHQVFRSALGCGPIDYLNSQRVAAAQRLLTDGDQTVLAVALEVGFGSLSHFYEQFRRRVGMPPEAWRHRRRDQ